MSSPSVQILAVDDEADLCALTKDFLEMSEGFKVDTVSSVLEAKNALAKNHYDAIISDYQMPGENGIQFLKSLRSTGDKTPFILFTGKGREEVVIEALNDGADSYLQKGNEPVSQYAELSHRIKLLVERQLAEKAAHDGEERYKWMFESAPVAINITRGSEIIYANSSYLRMFGCSGLEELKNCLPLELFAPECRSQISKNIRERANGHEVPTSYEAECIRRDGTRFPIMMYLTRTAFVDGPATVAFVIDVTKQKDSGKHLKRLNRELIAIKECNRALVKAQTENDLLNEVCRIVCQVAGYRMAWIGMAEHDEARSILPVAWSGFDHGYVEQIKATWADDERGLGPSGMSIKTGKTVFTQDFDRDDRTSLWRERARENGYRSSIAIPLLDNAVVLGTFMLYSDQINGFTDEEVGLLEEMAGDLSFGIISLRAKEHQAKMEEALRKSEERYSKLLATIPDLVIMTDMRGNIVLVNGPTLALSGYTSNEVIGHSLFSFMVPDDMAKAIKNAEMRIERKLDLVEYHLIMKDGSIIIFEANGEVLRDSDGRPTGYVFVGRDVSGPRQLELKLKEATRKLRVMDSITRHDITNQLSLLAGNLALMENDRPDHWRDGHLQKAEAAAARISAMIQFTKEYENVGVGAPTWHDIRTLADKCAGDTNLGRIKMVNDVPAGTEVLADPMIVKVFFNLIDNVMRHGGKTTTIRFSIEKRDEFNVIVCEDDGVGIPLNTKEKLFTKCFGKDHGVGLYLSREILAITDTKLTEEGKTGKGARFVMTPPQGGIRMV